MIMPHAAPPLRILADDRLLKAQASSKP